MEKASLQALLPQTRSIPSGCRVPACMPRGTSALPWARTPPADTPEVDAQALLLGRLQETASTQLHLQTNPTGRL